MSQFATTLESAGYVNSPFTMGDIWGSPAPFAATPFALGATNSALPELAEAENCSNSFAYGSDMRVYEQAMSQKAKTEMILGLAFVAVLAAAFYF